MDHIAIDLGGAESQICVRGPDGQIVEELRHRTARLAQLPEEEGAPQSRSGSLSEVSTRIDLTLGARSEEISRSWKSTCTAREALVSSRTMPINSVRGWTRQQLVRIRTGGVSTFIERVCKACLAVPSGLPEAIEHLLVSIQLLDERIAKADAEPSNPCGTMAPATSGTDSNRPMPFT